MKKTLFGALILLVALYSCSKSTGSTACDSSFTPCAYIAPEYEIDSVIKYLEDHGIQDTVRHCSGMFYKIDTAGTGKTASICSTITIKYTGMLKDSTVFDQSNSLTYLLKQFITGFKIGIPLIKEGGTIHLYIPPTLAYGSQAVGNIPSNSMLIFEVKLLSVQ